MKPAETFKRDKEMEKKQRIWPVNVVNIFVIERSVPWRGSSEGEQQKVEIREL